jgi:hypothetical protein
MISAASLSKLKTSDDKTTSAPIAKMIASFFMISFFCMLIPSFLFFVMDRRAKL